MVAVEIVSNAAFTSSRLFEGTSLGVSNRPQRFQVSILFMIFNLRSAALSLNLQGLVTGAWYPISDVGDDD